MSRGLCAASGGRAAGSLYLDDGDGPVQGPADFGLVRIEAAPPAAGGGVTVHRVAGRRTVSPEGWSVTAVTAGP